MARPRLARLTWATAAALALGVAALPVAAAAQPAAPPAAGAPGAPATLAVARAAGTHPNVAQPHSPQLLRALSAPASQPVVGPAPLVRSVLRTSAIVPAGSIPGAVQGVDVASIQEQPGINWSQVAAAGIGFAAIKSTEGDYYVNPYGSADLVKAQAAGLSVLAYAFAIPNGDGDSASPVVQADDLLTHAAGTGGHEPPLMLDIEYDPNQSKDGTNNCYGLTKAAMNTWISAFGNEIRAKTGRLPLIYTTHGWWAECTGTSAGGSTAFGQYPLWVADYTTASTPAPLPAGWSTWNLWQYTSSGTVSGIATTGHTDFDQLNPAALTILSPGTPVAKVGTSASLQLHASKPGLTYTATGLPAGLTLNATSGNIAGTPTTPGAYAVTVTVTDPVTQATASVSFTWLVHGTLTVAPPTARSSVAGRAVNFALRATDSASGQHVTFTATGLPPGMTVTAAGQVAGWPTQPGSYRVTVTGRDQLQATGSAAFTWTVTIAPGIGPTGSVRSSLAGLCLTDVGNRSASGTPASVSRCTGSAAQRWTYVQDSTLRIHGKCLSLPSARPAAGSKVVLAACTGLARQQWQPAWPQAISRSLGPSPMTLISPASHQCLADAARASGALAIVRPCSGAAGQSWLLPAGPLMSEVAGKCIDDNANGTARGNKIASWSCDGTAAQRWTLLSNGTIRVHSRCLGVPGTAAGSPAGLYPCTGVGGQQWRLTPRGAGFELTNPQSGRCLADPAAATLNGTRLALAPCAATPGLLWRAA